MWILCWPLAKFRHIGRFYLASLRASFWEELVFRGLAYGTILHFWHNVAYAIIGSSLLFGLAHMRNLWWAGWRRSWRMTLYTGLTAGPIFGIIRWLSGDVYLGILVHFLHNLFVLLPPPGLGHYMASTPTDAELEGKARR